MARKWHPVAFHGVRFGVTQQNASKSRPRAIYIHLFILFKLWCEFNPLLFPSNFVASYLIEWRKQNLSYEFLSSSNVCSANNSDTVSSLFGLFLSIQCNVSMRDEKLLLQMIAFLKLLIASMFNKLINKHMTRNNTI